MTNIRKIQTFIVLPLVLSMFGCGSGGDSSNGSSDQSNLANSPPAAKTQNIAIEVDTTGVIRSDISPATFGSGIESNTAQLADPLKNYGPSGSASNITIDTIKWLNLGTLRFPNGDSSFKYISENVRASYGTVKDVHQFSPDEIIEYTSSSKLNMERLFEVNTVFWYPGLPVKEGESPYAYIDKNTFLDIQLASVQIAANDIHPNA